MEKLTPLMHQYQNIKKRYADAILFFRLGDFYEMFGEDAREASNILEITLTSRQKVPMCGVPFHSATNYIAKLIRQGKKVAICEQMEDPKQAKGIVKREVIRLITPGTIFEENLLEEKKNNYLASIYPEKESMGLALADISTGELLLTEVARPDFVTEIMRFPIAEVIVPDGNKKKELPEMEKLGFPVNRIEPWFFQLNEVQERLARNFGLSSLKGIGVQEHPLSVSAVGGIIHYLEETQKGTLAHLKLPKFFSRSEFMVLDQTTQRNLELLYNLHNNSREGSLLDVLDLTRTASGGRLLRGFILHPLLDIEKIKGRQDIVEALYKQTTLREKLQGVLKSFCDLERLLGRLHSPLANARDLVSLKSSLALIPSLKEILKESQNQLILKSFQELKPIPEVVDLIESSIIDEPPVTIKEGGIIRPEYDSELMRLHKLAQGGKDWIIGLEEKERSRTGISSLKVGYTSVFGYYIEVTKPNLSQVPRDYIRKQTLINSERFVTPELKEQETQILGAEEKKIQLEYEIFQKVRERVTKQTAGIQRNAEIIGEIDVYCALSEAALRHNYVKPEINGEESITIVDGRHPVVEKNFTGKTFVPNDTFIDSRGSQILIITGPNMAGKSTYIRQVALITLMAQIGSFVPAREAKVGIVDRIFTRIGTSDNLTQGESTFMVEMMETANILNNYTDRSLLILDEVGRGTSTFDGISIAWAVVEHLHRSMEKGPRTLFATHYFELTELARSFPRVRNYNVMVREWGDKVVFLHKISEGSADKSYGIYVAHLAGLPRNVIERAKEILRELEENALRESEKINLCGKSDEAVQLSLFSSLYKPIISELDKTDPEQMTPLQALQMISRWKEMLKDD